jgi:hypothetical protein
LENKCTAPRKMWTSSLGSASPCALSFNVPSTSVPCVCTVLEFGIQDVSVQ